MTPTRRWAFAALLSLAGFLLGYGVRVMAEGAPTTQPLFYSGILEVEGAPAQGSFDLTLSLHDSLSAGSQLCLSEARGVQVVDGHFRVEVPKACVDAMREQPDSYLQVSLAGEGQQTASMERVKVGAVPYALEADRALLAGRANTATSADTAKAGAAGFRVAGDATVTGLLRVGARVSTTCEDGPDMSVDCTCRSGELAISGGAYGGNNYFLAESRHVRFNDGTTAWRLACAQGNGVRIGCGEPHAICVRLGQ